VWNHTECDSWLLDGQQRMTAFMAYVEGQFPVFGARYGELIDADRRRFDYSMPIPVVEVDVRDLALCQDIYNRLAYGGVAHE
jgi:hypothetical protein